MTKTCPNGKELNVNGNCVKKCTPPSVRNPETQRCKKPTFNPDVPSEKSVAMKLIELENLKIAFKNLKIKCDEDKTKFEISLRESNQKHDMDQNTIQENIFNLGRLSDQNRDLNDSLQRLSLNLQQCTSDKNQCNIFLEALRRQSSGLNDDINDAQEENINVSGIKNLLPIVEQEDSSIDDELSEKTQRNQEETQRNQAIGRAQPREETQRVIEEARKAQVEAQIAQNLSEAQLAQSVSQRARSKILIDQATGRTQLREETQRMIEEVRKEKARKELISRVEAMAKRVQEEKPRETLKSLRETQKIIEKGQRAQAEALRAQSRFYIRELLERRDRRTPGQIPKSSSIIYKSSR